MELNSIIFPGPKSSYSASDYPDNLIYIPRKKDFSFNEVSRYTRQNSSTVLSSKNSSLLVNKTMRVSFTLSNKFSKPVQTKEFIPCMFLPKADSELLLLYFHANYEDIGYSFQLLSYIKKYLKVNVLAVEYPKYGVYKADAVNAQVIEEDAEIVYNFLTEVMGIDENSLIVMGRCIGSGPAVHLATKFRPGGLVLMSAFTSIKEAVNNIASNFVGKVGSYFSSLFKERFENLSKMSKVDCAVCIIHGKEDDVIPWTHSLELFKACKCPAKLITPVNMNHSYFKLFRDFINPLRDYISLFSFKSQREFATEESEDESSFYLVKFPAFMFSAPV